jgi:hypothetical protein
VGPQPPPLAPGETAVTPTSPRSREVARKSQKRRRGGRQRTYLWIALVVVAVVGAFVARSYVNGREVRAFNTLASANGCGDLQVTSASGSGEHLAAGEKTEYDTTPPTHGAHANATIPAGVYDEPFSRNANAETAIYKSVHSLEHGAVIVWHDGLKKKELSDLTDQYQNQDKVVVVPYRQLEGDTHVALTSWGRLVECEKPSQRVIDEFIDMFRSKRPAPEPNNAI